MNKVNEAGYNEAPKFGPSQNNPPYISDDFQIGPDGAYEHNETIKIQQELINVLYSQVMDLSMMSKIELGDDVIAEIKRLKGLLKEEKKKDIPYQTDYMFDNKDVEVSLPGAELSDIENLEYFFEKYKLTLERGRPNLRAANLLKTYIDTIQINKTWIKDKLDKRNTIQIDLSGCKNWNECMKVIELITSGRVKIKENE